MNRLKKYIIILFLLPFLAWGQLQDPYLLSDFTQEELGTVLEVCQKGGFKYLIQKTPFSTYGHYEWNDRFAPQGDASVKLMVETAEAADVHLGVWVQDNAVGIDDAFFSAEYIHQYRKGGRLELYDGLTADETTIALRRNDVLKTPSTLNLLLIDNELVSYATLEFSGELVLVHRCNRGAFGTKASAHALDAAVYRIWDSPEHFVEPEGELHDLVRKRLEDRLGYFQVKLYPDDANQQWIDESIRVSQVERWQQQGDSLSSLGWFLVRVSDSRRPATTMEEVEWVLSKAVGFKVGYGLVIDSKAMTGHGLLNEMLETMSRWNRLWRDGVLTERQETLLRDPYLDWHLEQADSVHFLLYSQNVSRRYRCNLEETDPEVFRGETWSWNAEERGGYGLRIQVDGETPILNPMVNTSCGLVMFPCVIQPGQRLLYDFGETAWVVDNDFHKLEEVEMVGLAELEAGSNDVYFLCEADPLAKQRPVVTLRYITREQPMVITLEDSPNK